MLRRVRVRLLLAAVLGPAELRLPAELWLHLRVLLLEMRWRLPILLLRLLHVLGRVLPAELLLMLLRLLLWRLAEGGLLELL